MGTDAEWLANRTQLRLLLRTQPSWTDRDYADALKRSLGWVKKWRKRITAAPEDAQVLLSRSRARIHPPPKLDPLVIERILAIRDTPPENLKRIPGPKAILYYLSRDRELQARGVRLPRSTRTIWCWSDFVAGLACPPTHRTACPNDFLATRLQGRVHGSVRP